MSTDAPPTRAKPLTPDDFAPALAGTDKRAPVNFDRAAKFLFDLSFDAGAQPRVETPPVTLPADELEAIKRAMYEDGRAAGQAEAQQAGADRAAAATAQLAAQLQQLAAEAGARAGTETDVIAGAVRAITQSLLPAYTARHGAEELDATVRDCLAQLKGEARLVIRTAESEFEASIARYEGLAQAAAFPGKLIILADHALSPGDLRVEWADGGLERANGNLWAEVEAILSRAGATTNTVGAYADAYAKAADTAAETTTILNGETNG